MEEIAPRLEEIKSEHRKLEDKVNNIELHLKAGIMALGIVGVIFGAIGLWGYLSIKSATESIEELNTKVDEVSKKVNNIKQITDAAVSDAIQKVETKTNDSISIIKNNVDLFEAELRGKIASIFEAKKNTTSGELTSTAGKLIEDLKKQARVYSGPSGQVKECRVCFREVEGSNQCEPPGHLTCSGWSSNPEWTQIFKDDTDHRPGGCKYQWKLECR